MSTAGQTISEGNQGPAVDISIWICFIVSGFAILSKILMKLGRQKDGIRRLALDWDDLVMTVTLLFAAGQSVAVSRQVAAGLGTYYHETQASRGSSYEKSGYASQFLYVTTIGLAKVATFLFALKIDARRNLPPLIPIGMVATGLWYLSSMFIVAFQCHSPFWTIYSGKCINQAGFWTYVEVLNASIDVFLIITLSLLVRDILKTRTKFVLWFSFALRALTIPAVALRLVYIYRLNYGRIGHEEAHAAIATTVAMNISIITTCIPFLKPLMKQLQPGWATSDIRHGVGYSLTYGKKSSSTMAHSDRFFPTGSVIASSARRQQGSRSIGMGATLDSIDFGMEEE